MKKSLLLILFTLLLAAPSTIHAESVRVDVGQLRYTVDTDANTAELYGPVSEEEVIHDLVIPDYIEYDGIQIPVTSIRETAFYRGIMTINENATGSLVIGKNIKTIGNNAFRNCPYLTGSLTIGDSVTTIGDAAFSDCSGFTGTPTLGDSVTSIGNSAFSGCSGFTGSLTIGDSVTSIGQFAFSYCSGFTGSLTIGDSVTSIDSSAFYRCSKISSLEIKSENLKIEYRAFEKMDSLQSIICSSVTPPECVYGPYSYDKYIFSNYEIPLYVPDEAVEEYKVATEWKKFYKIEAIPTPATSIALNISEVELGHEETVQLVATVMPDDATDKSVTWASADEAVATVDENGLVTAVAKGTTTITATTVDGLTAECIVTVKASSGVDGIYGDGVSVTANGGVITVSGVGDKAVRVMTTDGKLVFTAHGDCKANVVPGIYIVAVGEAVVKVVAY
ncbi:MAG: leucine-rich repeat protein [Barnesiella sp.]|nr:leucine-rich repeat protein [Barnesiella sp.]